MLGRAQFLSCALAMFMPAIPTVAQQKRDAPQDERAEQIHQQEGETIIGLADAVMAGRRVPSDLPIEWRHDFLKAQYGTFVPFIVTIDPALLSTPSVLLYVRLVARPPIAPESEGDRRSRESNARTSAPPRFAVEEVYPVDMRGAAGRPVRVTRGFSARAGEYDLVVVVRERVVPDRPRLRRRTGVLSRTLVVPDFRSDDLTTSSVILADRLTVLDTPPLTGELSERPYLIGLSDIQPSTDNVLSRDEELIVVFLVYNPFVTPERKFDIEVEYHFFTKTGDRGGRGGRPPDGVTPPPARDGERYFNHTKPQRFTPAIMGPRFDPSAGHPLMAGQGIPLASFPEGEYRLTIRVTDVVTGRSILRDVSFSVVS